MDFANAPDILMDRDFGEFSVSDNCCEGARFSHFLEHSKLHHIFSESRCVPRVGSTLIFAAPYANYTDGIS